MKLAWLTDVHFEFLDRDEDVLPLCDEVRAAAADGVLIGGDIAMAPTLERLLTFVESSLQRPIYFVLGNHDFYGGSIAGVRDNMRALSRRSTWLRWLPDAETVPLGNDCALVGHDSYADGRLGNGSRSELMLNDFFAIEDFQGRTSAEWYARLAELGDEAAAYFRAVLPAALDTFEHVIVLTHVPPFREACWNHGRISDDEGLPLFACKAVGDVLREVMEARPDRRMTVLCGHTHSPGSARILPNLDVRTGHARYGAPCIQDVIVV